MILSQYNQRKFATIDPRITFRVPEATKEDVMRIVDPLAKRIHAQSMIQYNDKQPELSQKIYVSFNFFFVCRFILSMKENKTFFVNSFFCHKFGMTSGQCTVTINWCLYFLKKKNRNFTIAFRKHNGSFWEFKTQEVYENETDYLEFEEVGRHVDEDFSDTFNNTKDHLMALLVDLEKNGKNSTNLSDDPGAWVLPGNNDKDF